MQLPDAHVRRTTVSTAVAELVPVSEPATRAAAERLIREYLEFIAVMALENYRLTVDIEPMIASDLHDESKFYPPSGRFFVVRHAGEFVGVGALRRLSATVAELQRMYVQPSVRGVGAGRLLLERLLDEARGMQFRTVRLESLRVLSPAHTLYRSVGFKEIEPYGDSSMTHYQPADAMETFHSSAIYMELAL
jgi:GNAT superfamily N-acetyltransferase